MIAAGAKFGPYEIVAPLGAGGMGEVYRARDTRLGRDVALKVLPETVVTDADRLRRFEQEARAAGALQHPNILAVHDVGSENGTPYLVTELLEGESLRQRLSSGKLSSRKATEIAIQIARGLAAAHEKGIIHRDLKPDNVFLTRDGQVKILDFGLAKLIQSSSTDVLTEAPTAKLETHPGMVMGTAGYMAPEQVRGETVDHRADIFAFGAIVYEMLTGRRAFQRGTSVETMSAILNDEPPQLSDLDLVLPPGLERLVEHCLEKQPDNRFQSARDLAFDLESISGVSTTSAGRRALFGRKRVPSMPILAVVALLALTAGIAYVLGKRSERHEPATFQRVTYRRLNVTNARFAADGKTIVYTTFPISGTPETLMTRVGSTESTPLHQSASMLLSVSAKDELAILVDARFIGGHQFEGTLARVPMVGGAPRELVERVHSADWAPDGETLAIVRSVEGKTRLEFPLMKTLYTTGGWISHPRVAPDGKLVAFIDHPTLGDDRGRVMVVDAEGKARVVSSDFSSAQGLAWRRDGSEVWFTATKAGISRALYATDLDGPERLIVSAPDTLTLEDIAPDGTVLVAQLQQRLGLAVGGAAGSRDLSWLDWSLLRDLSDDGSMVVFEESAEGGGERYSVFLRKTDGSPAIRLGDGGGFALSPDGRQLLANLPTESPSPLYIYPTGAGEPQRIPTGDLSCLWGDWLPDGKRVVVAGVEPKGALRAYLTTTAGGALQPITPSGIRVRGRALSPDGTSLIALNPAGDYTLYEVPGGAARTISVPSSYAVCGWSRDSRVAYFADTSTVTSRLYRYDVGQGRLEPWKEIPLTQEGIGFSGLRITPDGETYAYTYISISADLYLIRAAR